MAYATQADLEERYGALELIQLTDRADPPAGVASADTVTRALADAAAEIDSHLAARYVLPLTSTPERLKTCCCILARRYLYADRPTEAVDAEAKRERDWLAALAAGRVVLGDLSAAAAAPQGAPRHAGPEPVFSRATIGL
ncbi:Mu-like prophage protein gp36 [Candidatus Defluviicoccus seviourii]|uniref:Mu-like prophage protein gp36 n=1 Tax=Candidatus Defluviicoccus seviourii TaxID=2565273 RepID=A0A564WHR4_9PROT|nr:Mu-like prophage protein gp36 [Candidatus Defluviicoccus seviourii]